MLINQASKSLPITVRAATAPVPQAPGAKPGSNGGFVGAFEKVTEAVTDTAVFAFNELTELGKDDPALALRYGATSMSDKLLEGVPQSIRSTFTDAIVPTIRASLLVANVYRANHTFHNPGSHWAEKTLDVARIATDTLGLVGSVLKYALPAKAGLGETLVGVAYAADTVSHSVRLISHGAARVKVWKHMVAERKAEKASKDPSPTPAPKIEAASSPLGPAILNSTQAPSSLLQIA